MKNVIGVTDNLFRVTIKVMQYTGNADDINQCFLKTK